MFIPGYEHGIRERKLAPLSVESGAFVFSRAVIPHPIPLLGKERDLDYWWTEVAMAAAMG